MVLKSKKNTKLHNVIYTAKNSKKDINKKSVFRIIDANLNRCREGLRVVEDSLRFVLDDKVLYKNIRAIRHNVDKILRSRYGEFIKERDSVEDSGRQIPETTTKELHEVLMANFKRVEESLRVLEEYSKVFVPEASAEFKRQRYLAYTSEKRIYLKYKKFFDKNN
jgi:thiamine-phosphate pyrophosphorylase